MRTAKLIQLLLVLLACAIVLSLAGCPTPVTPGTPTIAIFAEGSDAALQSGSSFLFGDVPWGTSKIVTFTIKNNGTADLSLTSTALASIGGVDAALFSTT